MEGALPMRPEVKLSGWRGHLTAFAIIAGTILALFHRDLLGMMAIWWNASTYGHCLFVPFLVAWLVQQRLPGLRRLEPSAWAPGLVWLGLGAFAWMLGAAAGVAVLRHGALILMLQGSVIALLGPAVARALLFPLFYAFFMVPFGEEIVAPLQLVTAHISMILLGLTGIPAQMQGIFITTPNGYFEVAEACSGAKFVIAMTAYGLLVCNVCFTSWKRRVAFMIGALSLSILANGVRAFATIFVAEVTTIDAAAGFDHVVYGWLFFAVIMIVVMAMAWPFFDRQPGDPWFDPEHLRHEGHASPGAVAGGALAMIVAAPLWLAASAAVGQPLPGAPAMPQVKGWVRSDEPPLPLWRPRFDGADYLAMARYRNAEGQVVDLAIATFDRQDEGRELVGFGQGAAGTDSGWTWSQPAAAPENARGEQITGPGRLVRHVVSFYAVGKGQPTGSAHLVKLETMKARLLGTDQRAAAIMVSAEERAGRPSDAAIAAFLHDLGDVKDLADRSLRTR
ncbi:exosortase [Sphingobium sp. 22B]|uniref:exosortase A n=1 Tax=unclassified Sphingobium TaxID=2611147 RepID=UPI000783FBCE|nr:MULTISPECIES: EpsI domain-containing exosortase [unclassified Sphingobium]KXU32036.1 exosortase [Sphingobium sp. AM]KYC31790.1 exosortase [Sphingobium sp. 22B]OAP31314.1 EpsI family protein [Sphingobium sp. 20006FA]